MSERAACLCVLALTLGGCSHSHSERNAPGLIEVQKPPLEISKRGAERPGDPGEAMFALNGGLFAGGGLEIGGQLTGAVSTGLEVTLNAGERESSHFEDDFVIYPTDGVGANLGVELISLDGLDLGPIYLEGQYYKELAGIAGGWVVDVGEARHGPQVTVFWLNVFGRVTHTFGGETAVILGLMGKASMVWVVSR